VLQQLAVTVDTIVSSASPLVPQLRNAGGSLVRERFRASVYCGSSADFTDGVEAEGGSKGSNTHSSTRDSGMPRLLTATVLLRTVGGSIMSAVPTDGGGACPIAAHPRQLLLHWSDAAKCTSAVEVGYGEAILLLTTWYSDGSRMRGQEETLCAEVDMARSLVIRGSVDVYRAELARAPENVSQRWKVVEAALHTKQLAVAREEAEAGTIISSGDALAWVMRGVVAQHDAVEAGGSSCMVNLRGVASAAAARRRRSCALRWNRIERRSH